MLSFIFLQLRPVLARIQSLFLLSRREYQRILKATFFFCFILFFIFYQIELGQTKPDDAEKSIGHFLTLNLNFLFTFFAFYSFLRNIIKLRFDLSSRKRSFQANLTFAFIFISAPAIVAHFLASGFNFYFLDNWLNHQYEQARIQSQSLSSGYSQAMFQLLKNQAQVIEMQSESIMLEELEPVIQKFQIQGIAFYNLEYELLAKQTQSKSLEREWSPLSVKERQQLQKQGWLFLSQKAHTRLIFRYFLIFPALNQIIEVFSESSQEVAQSLWVLDEQYSKSESLQKSKRFLRVYYISGFLFMTALLLFGATWFAFYLAKRFVYPIERLSEATKELVKEEGLGYQLQLDKDSHSNTDFERLMTSFNLMSAQLLEHRLRLKESLHFIELTLEHIESGVISIQSNGIITTANRAAKELFQSSLPKGKTLEETLNSDVFRHLESMKKEFDATSHHRQDLILTKNEKPLHLTITCLKLADSDAKQNFWVYVCENFSEIQRLERVKAWRDVARRVAHEIKNPLTPIRLSAEYIQRKYSNQVQHADTLKQYCTMIVQEVNQLQMMVDEFSKFAKIPECVLQKGDLNAVIETTAHFFANALPQQITLHLEPCQHFPYLDIDAEQLKQALVNLIDNAVASIRDSGDIYLRSKFEQDLSMAIIEVEDNGSGVPAVMREKIFEPYVTGKKEGTGLGLAIVSQIVSDHHGFIRYHSVITGGSLFRIELPVNS